ncbi:hypothetical protein C458_09336 [Haloferax sp. ATCC BAA-644]|nr:hypothetical protein C460_14010 [Haloferax sp. ATCC BAA-646]ELZ67638.1 hypothetical protein C459_01438 [Haloferax sp. ATCC BAA-645]ELZ68210.1 hypothetical protein C458_09336 [Haloferax sp. ATCC BAA-644]
MNYYIEVRKMSEMATVVLQWGGHGPMGPHGGHGVAAGGATATGGMGLWWLAAGVLLLLALAGVSLVYVSRVRAASTETTPPKEADSAMRDLRAQYARGEIDDEEFANRAATLNLEWG